MRFRRFLLALFWVALFSQISQAQWKVLKDFGAEVYSVHFLDREGYPKVGFVGLVDGEIWRTTDGGATWGHSTTPSLPIGSIRDFTFKDSLTGWFTHFLQNSPTSGVFKTTDGGVTWNPVTQTSGIGTSIFFNPHTNTLISGEWTGAFISTDFGVTWTVVPGTENMNMCGIAFIDTLHGLLSVDPTLANPSNFFTTYDGGITWQKDSEKVEAWQPVGIKNTGTYFIAAEGIHQVMRSDDSGHNWFVVPPSSIDSLTGDIRGDFNALYLQKKDGTMYSVDSGRTWTEYCGPGNDFDTRMYLVGDSLYAADFNGKLWLNPFGVKKNNLLLQYSSPKYDLISQGCFRVDSVYHLFNLSNCLQVHLTGAAILPGPSAKLFTLKPGVVPRLLKDTASDSLGISYVPDDSNPDSVVLELKYTVGSQSYRSDITIRGLIKPGFNVSLSKDLNLLLSSDCAKVDTFVTVKSGACGADTIEAINISDPASAFTVTPPAFPAGIDPGKSLQIPVSINKIPAGNYTATITLTILSGGITKDTVIHITATILRSGQPRTNIVPASLRFDTVSVCAFALDTIVLKNTICKKLYITNVQIQPPGAAKDFPVMNALLLPDSLAQNDTAAIIIQYKPSSGGKETGTVCFSIGFDPKTTVDTCIQISGIGKALAGSALSLNFLNFPDTVPCNTQELSTTLYNNGCGTDTLVAFIASQDQTFRVSSPSTTAVVLSGDSISIQILESSLFPGAHFDSTRLIIHSSSGGVDTVTIKLAGIINKPVHQFEIISFSSLDSLPPCTLTDTSIEIHNMGLCDTIVVDSSILTGPSWFALDANTLPAKILPGMFYKIPIHFTPGAKANGTGTIKINIAGVDTMIAIHVDSRSGGSPLSFGGDSIFISSLCKAATNTFTLQNTSCDSILFDMITLQNHLPGGAQFSFTPAIQPPIILPPGGKTNITITFDPLASGDSLATFSYSSTASGIKKSVPLQGKIGTSKQTVQLGLTFGPSSVAHAIVGSPVTLYLVLGSSIDPTLGLKNITATIVSYPDVLGLLTPPLAGNGWTLNSATPPNPNGALTVTLSPSGAGGFSAGSIIATAQFEVYVADSAYTPLTLQNISLNDGDPVFQSCILAPQAMQTQDTLYVTPLCSDPTLREYLRHGDILFSLVSIRPNPVPEGNQVLIALMMKNDASVRFTFYNTLGQEVMNVVKDDLLSGIQYIPLDLPKGGGGLYILTVSAGGYRETSKILSEH